MNLLSAKGWQMTLNPEPGRLHRLPSPAVRRMLRERADMTQLQMATMVGVRRPTVTRWEAGKREPSGEIRERYIAVLRELADA